MEARKSRFYPSPVRARQSLVTTRVWEIYRRFIHRYSGIATELTELTKASKPFAWTTEAELAFRELIAAFTKAPLLVHHDPQLPTQIETDASAYAISGIISQKQDDTHAHQSQSMTPNSSPHTISRCSTAQANETLPMHKGLV